MSSEPTPSGGLAQSEFTPPEGFHWYKVDSGWLYGAEVALVPGGRFDRTLFRQNRAVGHDFDRDGSKEWVGFVIRVNQLKEFYAQLAVVSSTRISVPGRYTLSVEHWGAQSYSVHSFRDVDGDGVDELFVEEDRAIEGGTESDLGVYRIENDALRQLVQIEFFAAYSTSEFQGLSRCSDLNGEVLSSYSVSDGDVRTIVGTSQELQWNGNTLALTEPRKIAVRARVNGAWSEFHAWDTIAGRIGYLSDAEVKWVASTDVEFESSCLQQHLLAL